MATIFLRTLAVLLLCGGYGCAPRLPEIKPVHGEVPGPKPVPVVEVKPERIPEPWECVQSVYMSQVGLREATGRNDGPHIDAYLASVNMSRGNPYCAAGVSWTFQQCGIQTRITAWSPTAYDRNRVVYEKGHWKKDLVPGHVFTLYYAKLARIGHAGFCDHMEGDLVTTMEFNSNNGGSRDGDGNYIRKRRLSSIHAICDFYP